MVWLDNLVEPLVRTLETLTTARYGCGINSGGGDGRQRQESGVIRETVPEKNGSGYVPENGTKNGLNKISVKRRDNDPKNGPKNDPKNAPNINSANSLENDPVNDPKNDLSVLSAASPENESKNGPIKSSAGCPANDPENDPENDSENDPENSADNKSWIGSEVKDCRVGHKKRGEEPPSRLFPKQQQPSTRLWRRRPEVVVVVLAYQWRSERTGRALLRELDKTFTVREIPPEVNSGRFFFAPAKITPRYFQVVFVPKKCGCQDYPTLFPCSLSPNP